MTSPTPYHRMHHPRAPQNEQQSFHQVMSNIHCSTIICSFLKIKDIFGRLSQLSIFHKDFVNKKMPLKSIQQCLSYDFGDILNKFKINLNETINGNNGNGTKNNNNNHIINTTISINNNIMSVSYRISRIYNDWDYLYTCAHNAGMQTNTTVEQKTNSTREERNFLPLLKLEKNEAIQHWLNKSCGFNIRVISKVKIQWGESARGTDLAWLLISGYHWSNIAEFKEYINSILATQCATFQNILSFVEVMKTFFVCLKVMNDSNDNKEYYGDVSRCIMFWEHIENIKTKYSFIVKKNVRDFIWCRFFRNIFDYLSSICTDTMCNIDKYENLYHCVFDETNKQYESFGLKCKKLLNIILSYYCECREIKQLGSRMFLQYDTAIDCRRIFDCFVREHSKFHNMK